MKSTKQHKIIAKMVSTAFGGSPTIARYKDDDTDTFVPILTTTDGHYKDALVCSTVGLSDHSVGLYYDDKPLGVEIVGASDSSFEFMPNIIMTCALNIIKNGARAAPGLMHKHAVGLYYPKSAMRDVLFSNSPYLWEDLDTIYFKDKSVAWLLAVPISGTEFDYGVKYGTDALQGLLEEREIDVFDLNRKSVV